tara:strand:+ start:2401 stop:2703 length:303 start_codon:yes stop_codon:yes gene_type:complete
MSKKNITTDEIKRIAQLSKLEIPDNELDYYAKEMSKIIDYFDILKEVDTSQVDPMTHVSNQKNVSGKDKIKESLKVSDVIKESPETFGNFIKIPKVLDQD